MPPLETDVLSQLVQAKRARLRQLRDMGRKQLEFIVGGDMTALLDLLSVKQQSLLELRRIEAALTPFRGQDPETRQWRAPEDRAACVRNVEDCDALLREIVAREKQCEAELVHRRDEAAQRLQGFHHAGQARGAYLASAQIEINHLDLQAGS